MFKKTLALGIIFLFVVSIVTPIVIGYESKEASGPMDSPWPMKCHDNRHTGRSPYSTADNPGIEKWRFACDWVEGGIVIDNNGVLYFGDEFIEEFLKHKKEYVKIYIPHW